MNLISCDNCGTVIDVDKISFYDTIHDEDGVIIDSRAAWCHDRGEYVPCDPCPVCHSPILQPEY